MARLSIDTIDPLTLAIAPPENETDEERALRERTEAEARRVSDEIDEQLRAEKNAMRKKTKPVKVLLLGQSESGTSLLSSVLPFSLNMDRPARQVYDSKEYVVCSVPVLYVDRDRATQTSSLRMQTMPGRRSVLLGVA